MSPRCPQAHPGALLVRAARAIGLLAACFVLAPGGTTADPLTPGGLLVARGEHLLEMTLSGEVLQDFLVPFPGGRPVSESVRDPVVAADGRVRMYNGTFTPLLSLLDPASGAWEHLHPGVFSCIGDWTLGGIAARGEVTYVTDAPTFRSEREGIVRLEESGWRLEGLNDSPLDVAYGRDGLLYATTPYRIHVFDPCSGQRLRVLDVTLPLKGIAVTEEGLIYAADEQGELDRLAPDGTVLARLPTGLRNVSDIDLRDDGMLVAGSQFDVVVSDTSLTWVDVLPVPYDGSGVFVAFTDASSAVFGTPLEQLAVDDLRLRRVGDDVELEWTADPAAIHGHRVWRLDQRSLLPRFLQAASIVAVTPAGVSSTRDAGAVRPAGPSAWFYRVLPACAPP